MEMKRVRRFDGPAHWCRLDQIPDIARTGASSIAPKPVHGRSGRVQARILAAVVAQ